MQECTRSRHHAPRARAGPGRSLLAGAARRRRRRHLLRVSARRIPALRVPGPRLQSPRSPELSPLPRQDPDRLVCALRVPISAPGSLSSDFISRSRIQVSVRSPVLPGSSAQRLSDSNLSQELCSRLGSCPDTPGTPRPCWYKCGLGLPCPLRVLLCAPSVPSWARSSHTPCLRFLYPSLSFRRSGTWTSG